MHPSRRVQSSSKALCLLLVIALVAACAQVNTNGIRRYRGRRLPAPVAVVVYDFEPTGSEHRPRLGPRCRW